MKGSWVTEEEKSRIDLLVKDLRWYYEIITDTYWVTGSLHGSPHQDDTQPVKWVLAAGAGLPGFKYRPCHLIVGCLGASSCTYLIFSFPMCQMVIITVPTSQAAVKTK